MISGQLFLVKRGPGAQSPAQLPPVLTASLHGGKLGPGRGSEPLKVSTTHILTEHNWK